MQRGRIRTDLAEEAVGLYRESQSAANLPDGILSTEKRRNGMLVTSVQITTQAAAEQVGKLIGSYITIDLERLHTHAEDSFRQTAELIAEELTALLPPANSSPFLIVGLGNRSVTPDALGPCAAEKTIATRHLLREMPEQFSMLRPVTVIAPGVLGMTGIESGEMICGLVDRIRPCAVVAIDALSARRSDRLCRTVQLTDTGIVPGSGVGNHRFAINRETIGVPCIAIGVPTVVDAATLAADALEQIHAAYDEEALFRTYGATFVTCKEIDRLMAVCAKAIGYAVNLALQPELSLEDIEMFLA